MWANFSLLGKREPTMLSLSYDGTYAVRTPCTKPKVPTVPLLNDIYYW